MIWLFGFLIGIRSSEACVIAAAPGASVRCLSEEALIVWNSRSRQQELIRSINVQSHAADFAYMTALPSLPVIRPVHQDLFLRTFTLTKPKVSTIVQRRIRWHYFFHKGVETPSQLAEASPLSSGIIAQSDNAVFSSSQFTALESWFHENRYAFTMPIQNWINAAFEKDWFVVISRIERPKSAGMDARLRVRTNQMSFHSQDPIYPYRESTPSTQQLGLARQLQLYLISDEQLRGGLEGDLWTARLVYSKKRNDLRAQLGSFFEREEDVPAVGWLSLFTEKNTYRSPDDDIRFVPVNTPKPIASKAKTVDELRWIIFPLDLILGCVIALLLLRRWLKP